MLRISLSYVYNYARQIDPLNSLVESPTSLSSIGLQLLTARNALEAMHSSLFGPYLRVCYQSYDVLLRNLDGILKDFDKNKEVQSYEILKLKRDF